MELPKKPTDKTPLPEEKPRELSLIKQKIAITFTPLYTFLKAVEEDRSLKDTTWDAFYPVISEQRIGEIFKEAKNMVKNHPDLNNVYEKFFSDNEEEIVKDEKIRKLISCLEKGNKNEFRSYFNLYGNTLKVWFNSLMDDIYKIIQSYY
jgi:hypothetical protein